MTRNKHVGCPMAVISCCSQGRASRRRLAWPLLLALFGALLLPARAPAEGLKILYYGNSFLQNYGYPRTVPQLVSDIAVAAGHELPSYVDASADGVGLEVHYAYNLDVISTGLPPDQQWDRVVLQGYSIAPTHVGDLALHRSSAVGLYQAVSSHSAGVIPVLFETWARGPGNPAYPDVFPGGPAQMQQELRDGYALTAQDIDAAAGAPITRIAPVGDMFEQSDFSADLYDEEFYHVSARGALLTSLVLYSAIYNDLTLGDINLGPILVSMGLTPEEAEFPGITFVPEPSAIVLAILGLAAFGVSRLPRRGRNA